MTSCTHKPDDAKRIIGNEAQCFTLELHGWDVFGCGEGDMRVTKFTCIRKDGQKSRGVICQGLLKGATVRWF